MSWRAVDDSGLDVATGRPPCWPGLATPAAALAAATLAAWPVTVVAGDGRRLRVGAALGAGGAAVEWLVAGLAGPREGAVDVAALARATPAGPVDLPVAEVGFDEAEEAAGRVDPGWLAAVDGVRAAVRAEAVAGGREPELEAALHLALLVAGEHGTAGDRVASGARLWLAAGAAASALAGRDPDPFAPWARLLAAGRWPVGPSGGRLVVGGPGR